MTEYLYLVRWTPEQYGFVRAFEPPKMFIIFAGTFPNCKTAEKDLQNIFSTKFQRLGSNNFHCFESSGNHEMVEVVYEYIRNCKLEADKENQETQENQEDE